MPEYTGAIAMVSLAVLLSPWIFLHLFGFAKSEELATQIILIGLEMLIYPLITIMTGWLEMAITTHLIIVGAVNVLITTKSLYARYN